MVHRTTSEEFEQKVKQLEKKVQDLKSVEDALKDYIAYQSVLSIVRGIGPEQPEEMLFQTFLSETVKQYGFCMSWYGQYSSGEIRPILSAGRVDRYLDNLVLEIREPTSPDAKCAMSQAILRGAPFTYADLQRDEGFRQWRDYALELGYRSNLALPLEVDVQVEGGFMVYAYTPNSFPEERIERLQLLRLEISSILSGRRIRQKAEEALQRARDELETRVEERTAELIKANQKLKGEIEERKRGEVALRESEEKYRELFEMESDAIFLIENSTGSILEVNQAASVLYGDRREELLQKKNTDLSSESEDTRAATQERRTYVPVRYHRKKDNIVFPVEITARHFTWQEREVHIAAIRDITERKRAEEALQKREVELEAQSNQLQEVNTALKVLLKQREEDRSDLEGKVLSNVKQLVSPHLQRLKKSRLDTNQRSLLSILESNLDNIVSPFTSKLSSKSVCLTPMELRIADLVKEGKTNKEIGEILCLSPYTVKSHRYNLRNKLGLKNKKINLRSHLLSLVK
jgi:PAS domain S-box-containing protein